MKDIKSLYLKAKQSGRQDDINRYTECVDYLLERNRHDYISNIEYIISSSVGLPSLKSLVENHGITLADYDTIMEALENCVKKCRYQGQSDAGYKEAIAMMESLKEKYHHSFLMYETFEESVQPLYIQYYYERKGPIINNFDKLYSRFGNVIIPDILIEAVQKPEIMKKVVETFNRCNLDPNSYEWIMGCLQDTTVPAELRESVNQIRSKSLQGIVDAAKERNTKIIREAVLAQTDDDLMLEFSEKEVLALQDLISFKEYMITCLEDSNQMIEVQKEVYELYQELGGLIEEDGIDVMEEETRPMACNCEKEDWVVRNHKTQCKRCGRLVLPHRSKLIGEEADPVIKSEMGVAGSVVPMLPPATQKGPSLLKQINELSHMSNTKNKHDGTVPGYIGKHHDLTYGEDEGKDQRDIDRPDDDGDAVLDDFRRPGDDTLDPDNVTPEDLGTGTTPTEEPAPSAPTVTPAPTASGNVQNVYYHTYVNSFNRQHKDDHSRHMNIKNIDSTMRMTDDHSVGKRIHSDNIGTDNIGIAAGDGMDIDPMDTDIDDIDTPTPNVPEGVLSDDPEPDLTATRQTLNRSMGLVNPEDVEPKTEGPLGMFNSAQMEGSETKVESAPWVLNPFDLAEVFNEGLRGPGEPLGEAVESDDVGSADDDRPKSDRPVRDALTDVDRKLTKKQQAAKRKVQDVEQAGRIFMKPLRRTSMWINNVINKWKDKEENDIKEKMADPHARRNLMAAFRKSIIVGSLFKAGILLNPFFLALSFLKRKGKNAKAFRLRNEMIGELKTEMEIIDEKIKDADRLGDTKVKYRLMRLKNEINKKLIRVGGSKGMAKMI